MSPVVFVIGLIVALIGGAAGGYIYRKSIMEKKIGQTEETIQQLLLDAGRKADEKKKEALLEAKEEIIRLKSELDKEVRERRSEVSRQENRINQREATVDKREATVDKRLANLESREAALDAKYQDAEKLGAEAQEMFNRQKDELERISNMTMEEAKQVLISRIQKDAYHDAAVMVREIEQHAKEEGEKKARNIISLAIQKCAADH